MANTPFLRIGGTVAAALVVTFGVLLGGGAIRPVDLLVAGERSPTAATIRADFGSDAIEHRYSYDGTEVYVVARSLPDVRAAKPLLGVPRQRLLRVLHPLLASPAPNGDATVLLLLAWNILGAALACGALADLAARHGRRPELAYAALLPLIVPLVASTNEPLAFGLAFAGVALADRRRTWAAAACLALAALTRETAIAIALATAVAAWGRTWTPVVLLAAPTATLAAWYVALGSLVGGHGEALIEPFGFLRAGGPEALLALATVGASLAAAWWWRDLPALALVAAGFGVWVALYVPFTVTLVTLPRVSAPSIMLAGMAGAAWLHRRGNTAPAVYA